MNAPSMAWRANGAIGDLPGNGSPARHVRGHQRLEEAAVILDSQVQQLMDDDVILKMLAFIHEVTGKGNRAL